MRANVPIRGYALGVRVRFIEIACAGRAFLIGAFIAIVAVGVHRTRDDAPACRAGALQATQEARMTVAEVGVHVDAILRTGIDRARI
jgi:hypothetical protein